MVQKSDLPYIMVVPAATTGWPSLQGSEIRSSPDLKYRSSNYDCQLVFVINKYLNEYDKITEYIIEPATVEALLLFPLSIEQRDEVFYESRQDIG